MSHSSHTDAAPPLKMGLKLPNSKLCMWLFLGNEIMLFTALIGTYGTADEFAFSDLAANGSPNFSFGHIVTLAGRDPGTNYQFRIESVAANGKKVVCTPSVAAAKRSRAEQPPGGAGSFTTDSEADTQRPVILTGPTAVSYTHLTLPTNREV